MASAPKNMTPKAYFVSLGCSKNRVDSEAVIGQLLQAGYRITQDPLTADVTVVNTCGFLQSAVDEALREISLLAAMKKKRSFILAVTGCLVQRMRETLRQKIPQIDLLIGVHGYSGFVKKLEKRLSIIPTKPGVYTGRHYLDRALTTGPGWAYLRIADGCDNNCSYCLIPKIRGPFRSRPMEQIIGEARMLVSQGVKEVNLIAQDTTEYGMDIYKRRALSDLLRKLEKIEGLKWIRILYTHPAHYSEELIQTIARSSKVVRYLDIPLQHSEDPILKKMRRNTENREITALLNGLRAKIPGLMLRTTFMVGFPGETDKNFTNLLSFVKKQRFDRVGAFAFSPEQGTKAAGMKGRIGKDKAHARLLTLMEAQNKISLKSHKARLGSECQVLIEGKADALLGIPRRKGYSYYGRSRAEAPEVDGKIYIKTKEKLIAGSFVKVKINQAWAHDLGGILIG
jgi:ribosomal protein S12 methylthiotransferase